MKQSSFTKVAEQVVNLNDNTVKILSKLDSISTTNEPTVDIDINLNGELVKFQIPSFSYIKSNIERLERNIKSIVSIDSESTIEMAGSLKRLITVNLDGEPNSLSNLEQKVDFKIKPNWFFDNLIHPRLFVEFDLNGKIDDSVTSLLSRRYIIKFRKSDTGFLTEVGALNKSQFDSTFLNRNDIDINDLEDWLATTTGVETEWGLYDEEIYTLEVGEVLWDGIFTVESIREDSVNRKLWYSLDKISYESTNSDRRRDLRIGDYLTVNLEGSSTRYEIIEILRDGVRNWVRFQRIEGFDPIPVGIGTLKYFSPVSRDKKLKVSIGYDEYNVVFLKPINSSTNLKAKKWSLGTAFNTNNLILNDVSEDSGKSMERFYAENVYDYGLAIRDLVDKKIPNSLGVKPLPPQLDINNFRVVQVNTHLTDNPDVNIIRNKHRVTVTLKNEIKSLEDAISDRNKKIRLSKFSLTERRRFDLEVSKLIEEKISKSRLLSTTSQEIIELSRKDSVRVKPKFKLRGFWSIPEPITSSGTKPQNVIGFKVEWRYTSKDGKQPVIETFDLEGSGAVFSNWELYETPIRAREFNQEMGEWVWLDEKLDSPDEPNINQIDISISPGERVQFRIKSISEVGYPESPIESDWSEIISIDFPEELNFVLDDSEFIKEEATREDIVNSIKDDMSSRGIDDILNQRTIIGDKKFLLNAESIQSGFRDESSNVLDLLQYLSRLEGRVKELEEKISRARGELKVFIIRNNQEFQIDTNSDTQFNVECEEFLEPLIAQGVPTGRVYANNIYIIKDFAIKISNVAKSSKLGLLSNRRYKDTVVYNENVPQTFWVTPNDELLFNDSSGSTKTQLDNQFLWQLNFTSVNDDTFNRISENIGNFFQNNSLTSVTGLNEFNIGYSEITPLSFNNSNNSLLETNKWIDENPSVSSTSKFLSTIHPVLNKLEDLVETNVDKVKELRENSDIIIPINIYFKLNAMDNTRSGNNYEWVNLNKATQTTKHIKKLKFLLENSDENRPFKFTLTFNLNRNKVTFATRPKNYELLTK